MNLFDDILHFHTGRPSRRDFHLKDAELEFHEGFFNQETADAYYEQLLATINWRETKTTVYGQEFDTPRLTAWHGDAGADYAFSGNKFHPFPWTPELLKIKEKVEGAAGISFNSVLLNLYRSGMDSVGWHRDDEPEFGTNPVIASVSFGETRSFHLKHMFDKQQEKMVIPLTHGSLLIMKGSTQHFWEHQVPKTARHISQRINLTFRVIKNVS